MSEQLIPDSQCLDEQPGAWVPVSVLRSCGLYAEDKVVYAALSYLAGTSVTGGTTVIQRSCTVVPSELGEIAGINVNSVVDSIRRLRTGQFITAETTVPTDPAWVMGSGTSWVYKIVLLV